MPSHIHCPNCQQSLTQVGKHWICPEHGQINLGSSRREEAQTFSASVAPLRIFLSYGHDANEELVRRIKSDLEERGQYVWFDKNEIKFGDDWRRAITQGIAESHLVLSFLSKYSTRDPGVCRDEIIIAIGVKGGNIQSILVESEQEILVPPGIGKMQWLDMHDWKARRATDEAAWEKWYQAKLAEIVRVVESDESRRFAEEIKTLENLLKPNTSDFVSDSRIAQLLKKPLVGRTWLFEAVENWRTTAERDARLFWLMGAPGIGKSAFTAHLAHEYGRGTVIAVQFCDWKKPDHRDACRIIRTLAFQIATRLPDYRKLLLTLPILTELDRKNSAELFDGLLTNPLKLSITGGRERYLIVIDALDEAGSASAQDGDGRNELVEVLAQYAGQLPDWIGLVVTSRPEFDVTTPFQALKPFPFETKSAANSDDIRAYLRRELVAQLQNRPDADRLVEQILEKSEGVFLYVESFCEDIRKKHLSLDRPNEFPQGLAGKFYIDFQRYFPDLAKYRKDVRPALRAILAAREPLPVEILQRLFNWQDEELRDFTRPLASLFPVTTDAGHKIIKPYHKSLADWLADERTAGLFFASVNEGVQALAGHFWNEHLDGVHNMSDFAVRFAPLYLLLANMYTQAEKLNCNDQFCERRKALGLDSSGVGRAAIAGLTMGRTKIIQQIDKVFANRGVLTSFPSPRVVAICGQMLAGKTRSAMEYADTFSHRYAKCLLIDAQPDLWSAIAYACAASQESNDLISQRDAVNGMEALSQWSADINRGLLVLDDVAQEQQQTLVTLLANIQPHIDVLITSECIEWPASFVNLQLEGLTEAAAIAFLLSATKCQKADDVDEIGQARDLARALGFRPLALETASRLIAQERLSFADYLKLYGPRRLKMVACIT